MSSSCGHRRTRSFVRPSFTLVHTMCTDTAPIRNTLNGFIVSPAYPHPMADNLKCSINIGRCDGECQWRGSDGLWLSEADPSMFIEVSPIQVQLQDAVKCRSEYLDIFGYDSAPNEKNTNTIWKSYQTWCGTDQSSNHPVHACTLSDRLEFALHVAAHEHVEETAILQDSLQK